MIMVANLLQQGHRHVYEIKRGKIESCCCIRKYEGGCDDPLQPPGEALRFNGAIQPSLFGPGSTGANWECINYNKERKLYMNYMKALHKTERATPTVHAVNLEPPL